MTITRFSTGAIRDNALATNTSFAASDMELIGTVRVGSGGVASVTFSNIPQEYKHLQIRGIARIVATGSGSDELTMRFNSDSGSNYYTRHILSGNGSSASSSAGGTGDRAYGLVGDYNGSTANAFAGAVLDILDYSSGSKFKTLRTLGGVDLNGSGDVRFCSSLWMSTAAINSINIFYGTSNLAQFTRISLYGIRG